MYTFRVTRPHEDQTTSTGDAAGRRTETGLFLPGESGYGAFETDPEFTPRALVNGLVGFNLSTKPMNAIRDEYLVRRDKLTVPARILASCAPTKPYYYSAQINDCKHVFSPLAPCSFGCRRRTPVKRPQPEMHG